MNINIYEMENNIPKKMLGTLYVRKNLKKSTITDKVIDYLQEKYNCTITNRLFTGKYDFATSELSGGYVLFGKNLPFRTITYIESEN